MKATNWVYPGRTVAGTLEYLRVHARYGFDAARRRLLDGSGQPIDVEVHLDPDTRGVAVVTGDERAFDTLEILGLAPSIIDAEAEADEEEGRP